VERGRERTSAIGRETIGNAESAQAILAILYEKKIHVSTHVAKSRWNEYEERGKGEGREEEGGREREYFEFRHIVTAEEDVTHKLCAFH
jgi:hypothetical protein